MNNTRERVDPNGYAEEEKEKEEKDGEEEEAADKPIRKRPASKEGRRPQDKLPRFDMEMTRSHVRCILRHPLG